MVLPKALTDRLKLIGSTCIGSGNEIRDGKEHKIVGSCSVTVFHRWNWKDFSVVVNCYRLNAIVGTS